MADERLLTSTIEGRHGAYTVDLWRSEGSDDYGAGLPGSPALPVALEIAAYGPIKGGEVKAQFGGGLIGSFWEATFVDPEGYLEALFGVAYVETDYYVRVAGPDGLGGTMTWDGHPMPVEVEDEQAAGVYPGGEVEVRFRDGIGRLQDMDVDYGIRTRADAAEVLRLLAVASPRKVRALLPVWPGIGTDDGEADDYSVHRVRFADADFVAGGAGERGDAEAAVANLARLQTLAVFQTTDLAAADGGPLWYALPRARVGLEVTTATELDASYVVGSTPTYPVTVAARALAVDGAWGGGPGESRPPRKGLRRLRPAVVTLAAASEVPLTRDETFVFGPASGPGDFPYWPTLSGAPERGPGLLGGVLLAAGDAVAQSLGRFAATPGLRFFALVQRVYYDFDATRPGQVRFRLEGDSGATYYYDPGTTDWETTPAALTLEEVDAAVSSAGAFTGADLPETGELFLDLVGETLDGTDDAEFRLAQAWPVAEGSEVGDLAYVRSFAARPESGYAVPGAGEEKALPLPVSVSVDAAAALAWGSAAAGATYGTLRDAAAAERLAQTARPGGDPLRALVTWLDGLVGPQTRITLSGAAPFDASPLVAVETGYEFHIDTGLTHAALCEVTTEGLT